MGSYAYTAVASAAGRPGSGAVAPRTPAVFVRRLPAWGLAAALVLLWLLVDPRTPDLAAQVYRVGLFEHVGFAPWDEHWYAGHALPGYSLLFPPLAALLGLRVVAALSVLVSATLFERLLLGVYGPGARWGAAWFAIAAIGDIWLGRLTFALGVTFAVAAVLALVRGRPRWAGLLAALCAAASPVAGVLLGLAALTDVLARRSPRALLVLALPAAVVVVPLALLFGDGGFEPFPIRSFAASALVTLLFLWALPPGQRLLRVGGVVYLLACALALVVHTPLGSNIERYAVLLAGPLLLCARAAGPNLQGSAVRAGLEWVLGPGAVDRAPWHRRLRDVGSRARDGGGGGERIDARLLLRACPTIPGKSRRRARSSRGAADALALGGRADGADGLARARLGEAAG